MGIFWPSVLWSVNSTIDNLGNADHIFLAPLISRAWPASINFQTVYLLPLPWSADCPWTRERVLSATLRPLHCRYKKLSLTIVSDCMLLTTTTKKNTNILKQLFWHWIASRCFLFFLFAATFYSTSSMSDSFFSRSLIPLTSRYSKSCCLISTAPR